MVEDKMVTLTATEILDLELEDPPTPRDDSSKQVSEKDEKVEEKVEKPSESL